MERSATIVKECMDDLGRRCREAGMNMTPQRMAVYKALLESREHPSPEMLYRRVRRSMPSLSLATIYKTLDTLEGLGLVREVAVGSETRRYDANMHQHHHLVCSSCHKIMDYYDDGLDRLLPSKMAGFVPREISIRITGVCEPCSRKSKR
ncbi:MAG: Fur family transcriptional regulator [Thermoanaerobaculia bacterium]